MITPDYKSRILVVDDNADTRRLINAILKSRYTILEADSGEEALQTLKDQDPPDLILLDIMMPGMDGYEVFEAIRKNPRISDIPIIFVTALGGQVAELKGFEYGAVDYITKPLVKDVLLVRIESALELHRYLKKPLDDFPELPTEFYEPDHQEPGPGAEEQEDSSPSVVLSIDAGLIREEVEDSLDHDYQVIDCDDSKKAFEYLEQNAPPDLILLDAMIPDSDGFEVLGRLKDQKQTAAIPVIFLTSRSDGGDEIRAFRSGAADFVYKPLDIAILKARIDNQLKLDRKRRQFEAEMERFAEG